MTSIGEKGIGAIIRAAGGLIIRDGAINGFTSIGLRCDPIIICRATSARHARAGSFSLSSAWLEKSEGRCIAYAYLERGDRALHPWSSFSLSLSPSFSCLLFRVSLHLGKISKAARRAARVILSSVTSCRGVISRDNRTALSRVSLSRARARRRPRGAPSLCLPVVLCLRARYPQSARDRGNSCASNSRRPQYHAWSAREIFSPGIRDLSRISLRKIAQRGWNYATYGFALCSLA